MGRMPYGLGASRPEATALTPGRASAFEVSIERMRACGCGECRILPNSILGTAKSSVYLPRPVTFAGESVMGSGLPMMEYGAKGQSPTGAGRAARDAVRSMASFTDS